MQRYGGGQRQAKNETKQNTTGKIKGTMFQSE